MTEDEKYAEAERVVRELLEAVVTFERSAAYLPPSGAILEYTAEPFRSQIVSILCFKSEKEHELPTAGETSIEVRGDRDSDAPDGVVVVNVCKDSRDVRYFDANGELSYTGPLVRITYDLVEVAGRFKIIRERGEKVEECSFDS